MTPDAGLYGDNFIRCPKSMSTMNSPPLSLSIFREHHNPKSLIFLRPESTRPKQHPFRSSCLHCVPWRKRYRVSGHDDLLSTLLKNCDGFRSQYLSSTFGSVWKNQIVLDNWGESVIMFNFKNGTLSECSNHRSVTLTPVVTMLPISLILPQKANPWPISIKRDFDRVEAAPTTFSHSKGSFDSVDLSTDCLPRRVLFCAPFEMAETARRVRKRLRKVWVLLVLYAFRDGVPVTPPVLGWRPWKKWRLIGIYGIRVAIFLPDCVTECLGILTAAQPFEWTACQINYWYARSILRNLTTVFSIEKNAGSSGSVDGRWLVR
ncbi:hypothetical protein T265_02836 [Opisthorchis viverrini]|uniref:Uncharacterized protein n=1 Tax=Opisthorchis viverrini TaxID=6198 RepID=A0A075A5C2_OPIVI|nr:hypothetical protein T265_02836 [Opisthorchis viverrini]KER30795.1 hypothetical protein T265_02836 [Opisthorchis viverrini]